jgi:hypothetical protein
VKSLRPLGLLFCTLPWLLTSAIAGDSRTNVIVPAPFLQTGAERSGVAAMNAEGVLKTNANRLRGQFDEWLKDPKTYREKALRECSAFPEGRIYPFAIPALGYANLALGDANQRKHSAVQMQKLIDLLVSTMVEDMKPPGGDLNRLARYQKEGTRLATLNLTLACYALISEDTRYKNLHEHVSFLLQQALAKKPWTPLASYPEYTWYFDTVMALVSLDMFDRAHGMGKARPLIDQHLAWLRTHATDAETGLPVAYAKGRSRGCDVSMQICLFQQVDPQVARRMYADYVKHHWVDYGFIAGFREWPKSESHSLVGDIDSGPLFLGIGPTATGVGLGAAKAVNDTNRLAVLARQLQSLPEYLRLFEKGGRLLFGEPVEVSHSYLTGFLYGDAVLFYAVTWVQYPGRTQAPGKAVSPSSEGG